MIERYSRPEMTALWSEERKYGFWLDVETAALEGMVACGIAPQSALDSVRAKAKFSVERITELEKTLKHDVIAFLTTIAESVGDDARFLHLGMTSSDLLDTAFAIQLLKAADMIDAGISKLLDTIKEQALKYKLTPCVGRSHGIHAEPTSFGLKWANWYAEVSRQRARINFAKEDLRLVALSGPVGTYAYLTPKVEAHVCKVFGLLPAPSSTQVIQRDSHAAFFLSLAGLASSIERIAVEIRHLQRTEVGEAEEYFSPGQKGSSAMPHKRNPILTENLSGLARVVRGLAESSFDNIPLWHERDISHSSAERIIAPDITILLDFMLSRLNGVLTKLVVYPERMLKNLGSTKGLVFSGSVLVLLTSKGIAREEAYAIVQAHAMEAWMDYQAGKPNALDLFERLLGDPRVTALVTRDELEQAFSVAPHLAHVDEIYGRVFGQGTGAAAS